MRLASVLPIVALSIATLAYPADVQTVLASVRRQVETSDYRATGQLVRVEPNGKRTPYAIAVKGLWFAGALHMLVDLAPSKGSAADGQQGERLRVLLEVSPDGHSSIRVFRPHGAEPMLLPFDKWNDGLLGGAFSYEDLLNAQYFWPGQTILKTADFGSRHCYVLKSTPGSSARSHYSQVETWLDRTIDYPVYTEKTLKEGGAVKDFTSYGLRQSDGVWSATQVEARIRGRAGSTLLIVRRGSAKANLSAKDFSSAHVSQFEDRP
ncbi:MAG: outer membrane lipoprotein-sorting protein [Acidobacteriota bacterium]